MLWLYALPFMRLDIVDSSALDARNKAGHSTELSHLPIQSGHVHGCLAQGAKLSIEDLMRLPIAAPCSLHVHMAKLLLAFWPAAEEHKCRDQLQQWAGVWAGGQL